MEALFLFASSFVFVPFPHPANFLTSQLFSEEILLLSERIISRVFLWLTETGNFHNQSPVAMERCPMQEKVAELTK